MKNKLCFSSQLYLGEGIEEKELGKIKHKLIRKPLSAKVYVLTFAKNPQDQLEFFDARQLVLPYYEEQPIKVIGIAKDYGDALHLVEQITEECLQTRGDCKLKEYLRC
ncbi:MAG: hypothetical protein IJ794_13860 [Lachnospiraceae bacterium]|nr:hypothetical protein [Lachnospiraceae bacterium]